MPHYIFIHLTICMCLFVVVYMCPVPQPYICVHVSPNRQALGEELARRLGRERCWRVRWPGRPPTAAPTEADADGGEVVAEDSANQAAAEDSADQAAADAAAYRKDANEVLVRDGREALAQCVQSAEPYPIRGLFRCVGAGGAVMTDGCGDDRWLW